MNARSGSQGRRGLNRRSFLRGAAGVSVALPFLESLPERSAWAADQTPTFSLFMGAVGGVVREKFFPNEHGALTSEGLAAAGKATSQLSRHAERLLFVSGVDYPSLSSNEVHQEGLCVALTGGPVQPAPADDCPSPCVLASGRSADWEVCAQASPGVEPIVFYYGARAFTSECLSHSSAGQRAPAMINPYELYQQLVGLASPGGSMTPQGEQAAQRLLASRSSVHDLVREELRALLEHPRLSSADHARLQQHLDSIRDAENTFGGMANEAVEQCSTQGLDVTLLESLKDFQFSSRRTDEIVELQMGLVALAFACNYRRSASIQWGDAYDGTIYDVPSNTREWPLKYISHRAMSDSIAGNDPLAAEAHAEIDAVRMATLARGLDQFDARGLGDHCLVLWTNNYADGPSHSSLNVPHIVWGSPGGHLKQGTYVDAEGTRNNRMLNALITAAINDTGKIVEDFGEGEPGQLEVVLA